jgi:hypothetical protein
MAEQPEVWLRGPIAGVDPLLMPAAHAGSLGEVRPVGRARPTTIGLLFQAAEHAGAPRRAGGDDVEDSAGLSRGRRLSWSTV